MLSKGMFQNSKARKKDLDSELNLTSFIDTLSVLVIFLIVCGINPALIGSINLKQGTGSTPILNDQTPLLVISVKADVVSYQLKNSQHNKMGSFSTSDAKLTEKLTHTIEQMKEIDGNLGSAIVLSEKKIAYDKIVSMLSLLKNQGIKQVGVSSL
jgi:biopolymer transport protein ExbD